MPVPITTKRKSDLNFYIMQHAIDHPVDLLVNKRGFGVRAAVHPSEWHHVKSELPDWIESAILKGVL